MLIMIMMIMEILMTIIIDNENTNDCGRYVNDSINNYGNDCNWK